MSVTKTSTLDSVAGAWDVLKTHIDPNDKAEASDDLINLLIDHDWEVADIKEAFRGDKHINAALRGYIAEHEHDEQEYEDDDHDHDDLED